jgi:protein-S-isoprenylcysteine O-methyltransferase Ste14
MRTLFVAVRALFFATLFVWLWAWVALSVRVYDRRYGLALPLATEAAGAALMAAGALLVAACLLAFIVRGQGTPAPFDPPEVFVAVGPYRYVRNPMYLGAWLLLTGGGLLLRSGAMLAFAFVWIFGVHLFVIALEEPGLRRRFGARYEDYCRQVHRWIPRAPRI